MPRCCWGSGNECSSVALIPGYNTPQQFTEAIAAIERRHAPYLVLLTGLLHDDDPILGYARQRFEPVATPWPYTVYRRAS